MTCGLHDESKACTKLCARLTVPTPAQPVSAYKLFLDPFAKLMEQELHANAHKGDRPGWLRMTPPIALLELYYHVGKLQRAVADEDRAGIREHAADVANLSMMLTDICGLLLPVEA